MADDTWAVPKIARNSETGRMESGRDGGTRGVCDQRAVDAAVGRCVAG